jgi:hypothetical protein
LFVHAFTVSLYKYLISGALREAALNTLRENPGGGRVIAHPVIDIIRQFGKYIKSKYPHLWIYFANFIKKLLYICLVKLPCLRLLNINVIIADMRVMIGETLSEISKALGISTDATEKRLQTKKIKPLTREALYPVGTTERIRDVPRPGRPPKPRAAK